MANGIGTASPTTNLQFQVLKATSGYGNITSPVQTDSFSTTSTSGQLYSTKGLVIASGQTQNFDFVSGALTDIVNNTISFNTIFGMQMLPSSGAALFVPVSGNFMQGVWGSGQILVPPGGVAFYSEPMGSGYGQVVGASGSCQIKAVSGACYLTLDVWGR